MIMLLKYVLMLLMQDFPMRKHYVTLARLNTVTSMVMDKSLRMTVQSSEIPILISTMASPIIFHGRTSV